MSHDPLTGCNLVSSRWQIDQRQREKRERDTRARLATKTTEIPHLLPPSYVSLSPLFFSVLQEQFTGPLAPRFSPFLAPAGQGMSRWQDALRGPTEPHLRLPGHRGEREQWQVPASLLHTGHAAGKLGVVHGQPTGNCMGLCQLSSQLYFSETYSPGNCEGYCLDN